MRVEVETLSILLFNFAFDTCCLVIHLCIKLVKCCVYLYFSSNLDFDTNNH